MRPPLGTPLARPRIAIPSPHEPSITKTKGRRRDAGGLIRLINVRGLVAHGTTPYLGCAPMWGADQQKRDVTRPPYARIARMRNPAAHDRRSARRPCPSPRLRARPVSSIICPVLDYAGTPRLRADPTPRFISGIKKKKPRTPGKAVWASGGTARGIAVQAELCRYPDRSST